MNNRHRRVARLKKQELNTVKKKFEKKYGISADNVTKIINKFIDAFGKTAEGVGNTIASLGRSLQGR